VGERGARVGVVTVLVRAAFLVNSAYAESGRRFGLTPQQGQLLCVLRSRSFGMGELTSSLGLAKSTTTGLVDVLERHGFVARQAGDSSRSVRVSLTPPGREVADHFYDATRQRIDAMLEPLDDTDRSTVANLVGRVTDSLDVSMIFMDVDDLEPDAPTGPAQSG
jgi:DNA-binding MarR family transcriptional regulator